LHTTAFGVEAGSYQQLKNGVAFLQKNGVAFMEQMGWDGKPRPQEMRRESLPLSQWPEVLDPMSDTYADQTFQGPLG